MKQSREFKESLGRFEKLFGAVIAVPKEAVEKEEAKEGLKNRAQRAKRKRAKKKTSLSNSAR